MQSAGRSQQQRTIPFDIWQTSGITEHMGGVAATKQLLELCQVGPGQIVLDIGCGTGYTACSLASQYLARVVAVDIHPTSVTAARERVSEQRVGDRVALLRADAHHLPCRADVFDAVVGESVLVFCDAAQAASEMNRALKPGGAFGANELTFLNPPPQELLGLLQDTLAIRSFQEHEWQSIFQRAGFVHIQAAVKRISFREQISSHIKVDGIRGYLSALVRGLADRKVSGAFVNRAMLKAARQFLPFVGYGIHTGRKAEGAPHREQRPRG
jgi:ubiquinone/menaquinone biosynthesis C-methylase UbiE